MKRHRRFASVLAVLAMAFQGSCFGDFIAGQDFNDLLSSKVYCSNHLPDGSKLKNLGSKNEGGSGLDFYSTWFDTRGNSLGPAIGSGDTSDLIGVNATQGIYIPKTAAGGGMVSNGSEHNFLFDDTDGAVTLTFETLDTAGYAERTLKLDLWMHYSTYEAGDSLKVLLSDGDSDAIVLDWGAPELTANRSESGSDTWRAIEFDIDGAGLGNTLTLSITVDNNSSARSMAVDNIAFSGVVAAIPEPTAFLFGSLVTSLMGVTVARRRVRRA